MAIAVKLYKTSDPTNKITKTLSNEISMTGTLKDSVDILNPQILISTSTNLSQYNYMYIADLSRYYFVKFEIVKSGLWLLTGRCDVLYTYKTEILNNKAVIERQQNQYNMYLNDDIFKVYNKTNIVTKNFPNGFNRNGSYLLTVLG